MSTRSPYQSPRELHDRMKTIALRMVADGKPVSLTALRRNGVCGDVGRMGAILADLCDRGVIPEHAISRRRQAQVDRTRRAHLDHIRAEASARQCRARAPKPVKPARDPDLWAWLRQHYYNPTRREWYRRVTA